VAHKVTRTKSFPTPLIQDVLFYETGIDRSKEIYADLEFGDPHYDQERWPDHYLVDIQPSPQVGDNTFTYFWAAPREDQDKYNWEHSKADFGGKRYDSILRSYVTVRSAYTPDLPKLGTQMPNVPVGKFDYSNFILVGKEQSRISERGRRSQATIGSPEMDSMFVVELHTYVKKSTIVAERYDASTNGPLYTRQTFYVRGEVYDSDAEPPKKIEDAVEDASYWVPTDAGQVSEFQQVSADVWVVTTQDLIPQSGLPTGDAVFGGTFLRSYGTSINYTWPDVLGSDIEGDGTPATGTDNQPPFNIAVWTYKDSGADRYFFYPVYRRNGYRGPTKATVHEEWLSESQMATAKAKDRKADGSLDIVETMETERIYYVAPYLSANIPACLHGTFYLQTNIGSSDPTWEQQNYRRDWAATNFTDWPDSLVVDVNISPSRGGYLVRKVTAYKPNFDE